MHTRQQIAAYAVHVFTASGVVFGFLALIATLEGQVFTAFAYLGLALIIDGVDGTLARAVRVNEATPQIDGGALDFVIDYFTYAVVPAVMVLQWQLVPTGWEMPTSTAIMLVSCYTFANKNMKTADGYFLGFPATWNILLFYLLIFATGPWVTLALIALCLLLSFVPTAYVHPFRVRRFMPLTLLMTSLWMGSSAVLAWHVLVDQSPASAAPLPFWALIVSSLYLGGLSTARSLAPQRPAGG